MDRHLFETHLRDLFRRQMFGVLATSDGLDPYVSLVAFAVTEDLRSLVFLTSRSTRKFSNIMANHRVSMLIDNRTNQSADLRNACAVTAIGSVIERQEGQKTGLLELLLGKHADLQSFALDPSSALIEIKVDRYILVNRFQEVSVLAMPA
jgi:nitroimidazol reductase NimA-like FMN-containing flavoprotein (pyridoxamine 5'-phosphate oxidase superfamily)